MTKVLFVRHGESDYVASHSLPVCEVEERCNFLRHALDHSLEAACLAYMEDTMTSGRMLYPNTNWTLSYDWLTQKP